MVPIRVDRWVMFVILAEMDAVNEWLLTWGDNPWTWVVGYRTPSAATIR